MIPTFDLPLGTDGRLENFSKPKLSKHGLYVIRVGQEIIRVGETSSGIDRIVKGLREPLRRKLRDKERKNYLAYHWRTAYAGQAIHVDYFGLNDPVFSDSHLRRALEAEVTFQLRLALRAWPKCMSEIHFLERHRNDAKVVQETTTLLAHYGHSYQNAV